MSSNYAYSIKVNEALQSYDARTHGPLARRVERLKRFTDMKNKRYADEINIEHARMMANQEREDRVRNRVREIYDQEFLDAIDTRERRLAFRPGNSFNEAMTPSPYNLRPRPENYGMDLLASAIENGFVNARRG